MLQIAAVAGDVVLKGNMGRVFQQAAQPFVLFKQSDCVALLGQFKGRLHSGRAAAHHGNMLGMEGKLARRQRVWKTPAGVHCAHTETGLRRV